MKPPAPGPSYTDVQQPMSPVAKTWLSLIVLAFAGIGLCMLAYLACS
jgi:hypothetical protein